MSAESTDQPRRAPNGHWPIGVSGNPSGRPVGSRNRSRLLIEELLDGHAEALINKAIQLALNGDPVALRICLDRLYPVPKERRIDLRLPEVTEVKHVTTALSAILAATAGGEITPGEAATLTQIVETQNRLLEARRQEEFRKELLQEAQEMEAE